MERITNTEMSMLSHFERKQIKREEKNFRENKSACLTKYLNIYIHKELRFIHRNLHTF